VSLSLILGCCWVLAATVVAFLPMRAQFVPGSVLLALIIPVLTFIGTEHGFWVAALGFAAFASMFRNPIRYYWRRFRGLDTELPDELKDRM